MLLRSTIYISHTWFECIILTEAWCYHTKASHGTLVNLLAFSCVSFSPYFLGGFIHKYADTAAAAATLTSNPSVFQFIARTSCNYIQLTHRPHLSTTQNHRQLIMWKMFIYVGTNDYMRRKWENWHLHKVYAVQTNHTQIHTWTSTHTHTHACMHACTHARRHKYRKFSVVYTYLANRMTIHLISINYRPFTLTNHVVFSLSLRHHRISSLTSFRLFSCACVYARVCLHWCAEKNVIVPKFSRLFRRIVYWLINSIQFGQKMLGRKKRTLTKIPFIYFINFFVREFVFFSLFIPMSAVKIILFRFLRISISIKLLIHTK